jgi:GIY-YIG catalytic domain
MTTGIYKLTFSSGGFYIGQSVDIEARWEQHFKSMRSGKAARPMQEQFNRWGYPTGEIIATCAKEYLDILENLHINLYRDDAPNMIVNTSIPERYSAYEVDLLLRNRYLWDTSLATLCNAYSDIVRDKEYAIEKLEKYKTRGYTITEDERVVRSNLSIANSMIDEYEAKIEKLKNRGLFARIFNVE